MFNVSFSTVTDNADAAQKAAVALQQHATDDCKITVAKQDNMFYSVTQERLTNCYTTAVKLFNDTVQQFCETVAEYIDDEEYPASCYVFDAEGHDVY